MIIDVYDDVCVCMYVYLTCVFLYVKSKSFKAHPSLLLCLLFLTSFWLNLGRHHQHGRWQARIGRVAGNKDLYLGTFSKFLPCPFFFKFMHMFEGCSSLFLCIILFIFYGQHSSNPRINYFLSKKLH